MHKSHCPQQAVLQLKDQLSSDKRKLSFMFGAGTSMAVGLPGVVQLTRKVRDKLTGKQKEAFEALIVDCKSESIEDILNKLRLYREVIGEDEQKVMIKIEGKTFGQEFDLAVCKAISELVSKSSASTIQPHLDLVNWLFRYQSNRIHPVEIFTTNYDLLFEEAFEERRLPYFDGFIGTINPFLVPECIEAENNKLTGHVYVPLSWLRFWKIHGSINWFLYRDGTSKNRITRNTGRICTGDELMIYPSRQKYDESRRLPFLLFQDRLRKFLSTGEVLFIISGYSFNDEHINEVIFQSLRANKRLAITALLFGDFNAAGKRSIDDRVLSYGIEHPNLTILGPDKACIGGNIAKWEFSGTPAPADTYWIESDKIFDLGNFLTFTAYLKNHF
jgi:hypothetical protein